MSEFTLTKDSPEAVFLLGFEAGAHTLRQAADLYGWDRARATDAGGVIAELMTEDQKAQLYGLIRDIVGGRVPSPFATPGLGA